MTGRSTDICKRQRSLGRGYVHEERVIDALRRFLKKNGCVDLDQAAFDAWCASQGPLAANTRRNRQRIVRNFCLNRQRAEPTCFIPDINRFPRRCPHAPPVIFEPAEVARMLAVAERLAPTPGSPLRPAVMRLAVVLLYTAGLRRGELLRLTLADVDPHHGVLRIRESKFHKSRIVPLSPDASRELKVYLRKRRRPPLSCSADSSLLCHVKGVCAATRGPAYATASTRYSDRPKFAAPTGGRRASMTFVTASPSGRCCAGTGKAPTSNPICPSSRCIWGTSRSSLLPITCDGCRSLRR